MMEATAIKERPIVFSGPMVRAILDGTKTQTRRVIKPQPEHGACFCPYTPSGFACESGSGGCTCKDARNPFGMPGQRLWVRETHGFGWDSGSGFYTALRPSGEQHERPDKVFYRAQGKWDESQGKHCWRPSIHMPRWASRITLEITGVRVQRLEDITESDAIAEGVSRKAAEPPNSARSVFAALWDDLNANRGFGWGSGCWVWAITFKVIEPPSQQSGEGTPAPRREGRSAVTR